MKKPSIGFMIGAVTVFLMARKQSSPNLALSWTENSYKYDCTKFEIKNKEAFLIVNRKYINNAFSALGAAHSSKILDFKNYILGFWQKYLDQILKKKCDTAISRYVKYVLGVDAILELKTFLPTSKSKEFDAVAPSYYQIIGDYLHFTQDDFIKATHMYLAYKETGIIKEEI